ncbi:Hypothetical protein CAP_1006 [Chondromyces apiculatus DSM 436]|uniref:Uncharacterized protein n=1 Tax=Chondromyces apiculatus DSM 436 TaxID=1192034 RepID=A0A017SU20_9BACT|nr:Hypothetical protein CAP_1006 [Chondromyces apiculatus DSM 436]
MARGVLGRQLHRLRREADGVVVAVQLRRVLRHALVQLPGPLRVHLHELLQHLDGPEQVLLQHQHPLQREPRLLVAGRRLHHLPQRRLRVGQLPELALHLREQPPRLQIGRRPVQPRRERRDPAGQLVRQRPQAHDVRPRLARQHPVAARSRAREQLLPERPRLHVARPRRAHAARGPLDGHGQRLLVAGVRRFELRRLAQRRERLGDQIVVEVHLPECRRGPGPVRHHPLDPRPGLQRLLLVAGLEVPVSEIDEVARVAPRRPRELLQHPERPVLLLHPLVEIGHGREQLRLRRDPRLQLREQLQRLRPVAALDERLAQLEHEVRVARRRLDEQLVLLDRRLQLTGRLEQVHQPEARIDVLRVDPERLPVDGHRPGHVPGFLVERPHRGEPLEVLPGLRFEQGDQLGELALRAEGVGHDQEDLGPQPARPAGDGERALQHLQRLQRLLLLRERLPEVTQRRRQRPVVACRRLHQVAELRLRAVVVAPRRQLAPELRLHEQGSLRALHQRVVLRLRRREVLQVQAQPEQRAPELLHLGRGLHERQRLLVAPPRRRLVPPVRFELRERQDRGRILRLLGDGRLVRLHRVVVPPVLPVDPRERHLRRPRLRPGLGRAPLEVLHELLQVPVPLAVELRQPLQRERRRRLAQHDGRVPRHERVLRRRLAAGLLATRRGVGPLRRPRVRCRGAPRPRARPCRPAARLRCPRLRRLLAPAP